MKGNTVCPFCVREERSRRTFNMEFKLVKFLDVDRQTWNDWVQAIPECNYYHSWEWLNYNLQFPGIEENLSFALLNTDGNLGLAAVCPLAVSRDNQGAVTISFAGVPCGIPALAKMTHSQRQQTLSHIFVLIQQHAERTGAKKVLMVHHSLNNACCNGDSLSQQYAFEPLRQQMVPAVWNTCVVDLSQSPEMLLANVSKFQRKNIQKAKKHGIEIKVFDGGSASADLEERMKQFQHLHVKAAGRVTRPQATWDAMKEGILNNRASIFVAFLQNKPISYLYCGEFSKMAFGWSQVNDPDYEKEYSPRHLLEWQAIVEYQNRGFKFYEVGTTFSGPQLFYIPSEKEKSISTFKERFGGILLTRIMWTGYYDVDMMREELARQVNDFADHSRETAALASEEE